MSRILLAFWSGSGNTRKMAELIREGAGAAGAEATLRELGGLSVEEALDCDVLVLGSPPMAKEKLEETIVEPFVEKLSAKLAGRKLALFGSFGWGDGEYMAEWAERMRGCGALLLDGGLTVQEDPIGEDVERCREFGRRLAAF